MDEEFAELDEALRTGGPLYADLGSAGAPDRARFVHKHLNRWIERFHPGSMQHDAMTLATALLWPGIRLARERISVSPEGHLTVTPDGVQVNLSDHADYSAFLTWLRHQLGLPRD